LTRIEPA